jgi:hypothetical protein
MTTLVRIQRQGQMTLPSHVRSSTDDRYTPAQRRAIDRGIARSLKEYKQGRGVGPFDTHEAFIASLRDVE